MAREWRKRDVGEIERREIEKQQICRRKRL